MRMSRPIAPSRQRSATEWASFRLRVTLRAWLQRCGNPKKVANLADHCSAELGSFGLLVLDLDAKGIRSRTKKAKKSDARVASPFTYGPLAYLLNNRLYIGEVPHKDKWHPGEHPPIIAKATFDAVQTKLAANSVSRKNRRSESGALLMGKLFDDRDNRMSPSYSTKKGV